MDRIGQYYVKGNKPGTMFSLMWDLKQSHSKKQRVESWSTETGGVAGMGRWGSKDPKPQLDRRKVVFFFSL